MGRAGAAIVHDPRVIWNTEDVIARNGGGAILNVLSVLSWLTLPHAAAYCAAWTFMPFTAYSTCRPFG